MSKEYWEDREKERLDLIDISVDERIKDIENIMNSTVKKLENEILKLYEKYANDNELSYQEALLYLNDNERKEFQKDLKYYIETSKNREKSTMYRSELQALSTRDRVKRLEVLKANIKIQSTELERLLMDEVPSTFNSIYQDSYFYNLYSQCLYTDNLGLRFDIPSPNIIKELLNNPWSGKNYSDKVWNITSNFNYKLDSVITSGLIRGEHPNIIAKNLKEATLGKRDKAGNIRGGKLYDCKKLVRTEAAFIAEQATKKSYDANNIKEYEYLATLDLRTSVICQSLDGKVFKVKDAVTGLNYPPMHCFCRSTTVPVIKWDGENDNSYERISRDPIAGRNSYIDDTDYTGWKDKQYTQYGEDKVKVEEKKIINRTSDKKQYYKYKEVLKDLMPDTFDKYQNMKYNNKEEWITLKENFKVLNMYKVDFGNLSPEKIIYLDKLAFYAKRNNHISKYKHQGNFAILEYDNKIKYASSKIAKVNDKYYAKYKGNKDELVLLKDDRIFKTSTYGDIVDGKNNEIPREYDTEAKFFEFLAEKLKNQNINEINMLSEKKMCESCKGVAKQFIKKYPNIKVNVVSGTTFDGWKGR